MTNGDLSLPQSHRYTYSQPIDSSPQCTMQFFLFDLVSVSIYCVTHTRYDCGGDLADNIDFVYLVRIWWCALVFSITAIFAKLLCWCSLEGTGTITHRFITRIGGGGVN